MNDTPARFKEDKRRPRHRALRSADEFNRNKIF